jgi:hypothetical protein
MDSVSAFLANLSGKELISPLAAILGSIAGAWWGARLRMRESRAALAAQARKWQESLRNQKISFLKSILAEVAVLWRRYYELLGRDVESFTARDIRTVNHTFSQDYFTVFHSSAGMLGLIDNSDVPPLIVDTYLQAKAVIDIIHVISHENREILRLEDDRHVNRANAAASEYYAHRIAAITGLTEARFRKLILEHEKFRRAVDEFTRVMAAEVAQLSECRQGDDDALAGEDEPARAGHLRRLAATVTGRALPPARRQTRNFTSDMKVG